MLFQPLFDELLSPPPSVDHPAPEVLALITKVVAPEHARLTGSPSSTIVDQDAPSPSKSQSTQETQSPVITNNVEEDNHDIEVAHMVGSEHAESTGSPSSTTVDQDAPSPSMPILEVSSDQSSSTDYTIVHPDYQITEHNSKWINYHPLENVIGSFKKHLHAVKRIFRYVQRTVNRGLWYPKDSLIALIAFADVDHAGCQDTRHSTSDEITTYRLWPWIQQDSNVLATELYRDVNINLEGQQQSSSVSSRFISNMLNPSPDTGIDSIFDSTPLVEVLVTTAAEPPLLSATTLPPPTISIILHVQQTPAPSPTKDSLIALTAFADADHAGCQDTRRSTSVDTTMVEKSKLDEDKEGKAVDLSHYN
nr:uncharacterized mitochondrial protein AtMg00810-like [Tanacetum cinerariifolium]